MSQLSDDEVQAVRRVLVESADWAAKSEIADVLYQYCRGVDRGDKTLIVSAFFSDAVLDHGAYFGSAEGFADQLMPQLREVHGSQHSLCNILIELDGGVARVESYFIAAHRDNADPATMSMFGGRYLDQFQLRDGRWRVARRTTVNDWSFTDRIPRWISPGPELGFVFGRGDSDDAVFVPHSWGGTRPS